MTFPKTDTGMLNRKSRFNHMFLFSKTKRLWLLVPCMALLWLPSRAQDSTHLSLTEAVRRGLDSSKQVKLSEAKVTEALTKVEQASDKKLPTMKATFMASEAFIPTRTIQIDGLMKNAIKLPSTSMVSLGTFGINQAIFAGNRLKYAKQSAELVKKIADLNVQGDKQDAALAIVEAYINLYKIDENLRIVEQNLSDVQGRLRETVQFKDQGLATQNDVLRFQLQKANVELTRIDLENNRAVANYAMDVLLGYPEQTVLKVDSVGHTADELPAMGDLIAKALAQRAELKTYQYQSQISEVNVRDIKAAELPELGAGLSAYYINPTKKFFPPAHNFLVPVTLGLNLSWNISNLYTSKHKVAEAQVQQAEANIGQSAAADRIRVTVSQDYHHYAQALERIRVLGTAVDQARENDRIMELKYKNQLATTTDRIDAQTMLYQSLVNLELAKADAADAYYHLLRSTGTLNQTL